MMVRLISITAHSPSVRNVSFGLLLRLEFLGGFFVSHLCYSFSLVCLSAIKIASLPPTSQFKEILARLSVSQHKDSNIFCYACLSWMPQLSHLDLIRLHKGWCAKGKMALIFQDLTKLGSPRDIVFFRFGDLSS